MDIGKRIRDLREERGLTQREVARRAGLTPSGVGFIEHGQTRNPSAETVVAIARALGVPVEDLLEEPTLAVGKDEASDTGPAPTQEEPLSDIDADLETIRGFLEARTGTAWITLPDKEWDRWWLGVPRDEVVERYEEIAAEWRLLKQEMAALTRGKASILAGINNLNDAWGKFWARALEARYSVPRREEGDKEFQRRRLEGKKFRTFYEPLEFDWLPAGSSEGSVDQERGSGA